MLALLPMFWPVLVLCAAIGLVVGIGARRRWSGTARTVIVLSAPGVIVCLTLVPYVLAGMAFGAEPVRQFMSPSTLASRAVFIGFGAGIIAPASTLAAIIMALTTRQPLPRYMAAIVVTSLLGTAAFWAYFAYFITHFGI